MQYVHLLSVRSCDILGRRKGGESLAPRKYTEARKEGNRKWDAANLDRISVAMKKGKKDEIKAAASAVGESMNQYIVKAIDQRMERDKRGAGE